MSLLAVAPLAFTVTVALLWLLMGHRRLVGTVVHRLEVHLRPDFGTDRSGFMLRVPDVAAVFLVELLTDLAQLILDFLLLDHVLLELPLLLSLTAVTGLVHLLEKLVLVLSLVLLAFVEFVFGDVLEVVARPHVGDLVGLGWREGFLERKGTVACSQVS